MPSFSSRLSPSCASCPALKTLRYGCAPSPAARRTATRHPCTLFSFSLAVRGTIYKANTVRHPAIKLYNASLRFTGSPPPLLPSLSLSLSRARLLPPLPSRGSRHVSNRPIGTYTVAHLVPPSAFTPYLGLTRQRIN